MPANMPKSLQELRIHENEISKIKKATFQGMSHVIVMGMRKTILFLQIFIWKASRFKRSVLLFSSWSHSLMYVCDFKHVYTSVKVVEIFT